MNSNINSREIYPKIQITKSKKQDQIDFNFRTFIRIKFDDLYYLKIHTYGVSCDNHEIECHVINNALEDFHKDVYLHLICSKIDFDLFNEENQPVYTLDENQDPETKRLEDLLTFHGGW